MRIAQVSPLFESVPPQGYGGTERVVFYLTEELVRQGHDVTLYASADSRTTARLEPLSPRSLRSIGMSAEQWLAYYTLMVERVVQQAGRYDVIHSHIDGLIYPLARRIATPSVHTVHGRLDLPELEPLYREFRDIPLVSISNAQRGPLPYARWMATVHHGLPPDLFHATPAPGEYLAFLGRISAEKRVDRAVQIAERAGLPIRVAAKVDPRDHEYFDTVARPFLNRPGVRFMGEISDGEKNAFLGRAAALLLPVDWPEPFGMVIIEAMACGTPVISYRAGAIPELIEDGVTGFIVSALDDAVRAVRRLPQLDRRRIRARFEERFTASRMAAQYIAVYRRLVRPPASAEPPASEVGALARSRE